MCLWCQRLAKFTGFGWPWLGVNYARQRMQEVNNNALLRSLLPCYPRSNVWNHLAKAEFCIRRRGAIENLEGMRSIYCYLWDKCNIATPSTSNSAAIER